jgi:hypothetical protein
MVHDREYSRLKSGSILKRCRNKFNLEPRYEELLGMLREIQSLNAMEHRISFMENSILAGLLVVCLVLAYGIFSLLSLPTPA